MFGDDDEDLFWALIADDDSVSIWPIVLVALLLLGWAAYNAFW